MTITYAYHFIAEAVIILFLSVPIFHFYYDAVPYVTYSVVAIVAACIYVALLHRVTSYIPYVLVAPILAGSFYVLAIPLWISIVFAVLLTYSAIRLRNEHKLENEGTYLRVILAASILIPIFIHDVSFIIFVVSTLLLLIIGNTIRNMTVLPKEDKRGKSTWFLTSMVGLIVVAITAMYFSFNGVRAVIGFVWGIITTALAQVGSFFVYLMSLIPIPEGDADEESTEMVAGEEPPPEHYDDSHTLMDDLLTWALIIICIIAAFFIIRFIIRLMKKSFKQKTFDEEHVTYEDIGRVAKKKGSWKERFRSWIPTPKDHVRKRVYQFEKKMSATEHARKQDETIEEWVKRAGWDIDFELYQRVRYGTHVGTREEAEQLKQKLHHIQKAAEDRAKE